MLIARRNMLDFDGRNAATQDMADRRSRRFDDSPRALRVTAGLEFARMHRLPNRGHRNCILPAAPPGLPVSQIRLSRQTRDRPSGRSAESYLGRGFASPRPESLASGRARQDDRKDCRGKYSTAGQCHVSRRSHRRHDLETLQGARRAFTEVALARRSGCTHRCAPDAGGKRHPGLGLHDPGNVQLRAHRDESAEDRRSHDATRLRRLPGYDASNT